MKNILLTSTAMIMVAGIAAADGHFSMDWSGKAKAGLARQGGAEATAAKKAVADATALTAHITLRNAAADGYGFTNTVVGAANSSVGNPALGTAISASEAVTQRKAIADELARDTKAASGNAMGIAAAVKEAARLNDQLDHYVGTLATAKKDAGDFKAYSEVSATVVGTVTAGAGLVLSAAVSVDAGTGYDFGDDDGDTFDKKKENGVSLDSVSLDMGPAGKLTLDDNAVAHMVDGDDDGAADVSYKNTFGGATFTAVMDLEKDDSDIVASKVVLGTVATATVAAVTQTTLVAAKDAVAVGDWVPGTAAVAADVQWSAKVEMPLGGGSVYVAMDEESGNAFGGKATISGMTVSIDSKLEALASDLKGNRANTLGVEMTMGPVKGKFTYDSIKDGNQWGVEAGYTAGEMNVAFKTNEASSWEVTGGYKLGDKASIEAGVNYTEDAFLGLSFAF